MDRSSLENIRLEGEPGDRLLALHRRFPESYPVLLESAAHGTPQGRYSLLLARPGERLAARDLGSAHFLQALDEWFHRERRARRHPELPLESGWFLFLGYELAGAVEPSLRLPPPPPGEESLAWRMHAALIHDHMTGETRACAEAGQAEFGLQVRRHLAEAAADASARETGPVDIREDSPGRFLDAVRRTQEKIAEGEVYQVNLSRAWKARLPGGVRPADVYARLRRSNPGPFAGSACLGATGIVSSSPERLVSVRGRRIETRPIAGTRPRLTARDAPSIEELINHPKERAEHIMLIDLERNDLGRLCEPGTVEVDELMCVESYAHVHHIVSNVTGRLRPAVTPGQVVRALFPGGTITGCPKVRCMQIIGDLEAEGRGAYTGSMGWLGLDGDLDLNILIRTLTLRDGTATLRAGAGIVADSDPQRELEETRAKARGVLLALEGGA